MTLRTAARLSPAEVAQVRALAAEVAAADGHPPLSDQALLHLPVDGPGVLHVLAGDHDALTGYAHLDVGDPVGGPAAELAVAPAARRRGTGRALLDALLAQSPDGRLSVWAHGEHPGAVALAGALGFARSRVLWQMRRPLDAPLPAVALPDGVTLRTFEVGRDEAAWTALNALAFADHPEQGSWGPEEVALREQEPWFDPLGFFLAERAGPDGPRLVGFHWTKVHDAPDPGSPALGEVYVVGVDPSEQGRGLGPALTLAGLQHLADRGLPTVLLYVDEANVRAVALYRRLGFTVWSTDVSFTRG